MALPDLIPRSVLFGNPERSQLRVSPDGALIGWTAPDDGVLNVWIAPRDGGVGAGRVVTRDRDRGIRAWRFAYDNRHLLYIQDRGGDENWRIYAVDLQTGTTRDLTPFEGVQAQILSVSPRRPDAVLVGLNNRNPGLHDVYVLDLPSGELTLEVTNPGFFSLLGPAFVFDEDLRVRAATKATEDGGSELLVPAGGVVSSPDTEWKAVLKAGLTDSLVLSALGATPGGDRLLLRSALDADTAALVEFDPATGDAKVLARDPEYDVLGLVRHPSTREVQAVSVARDRADWIVLDAAIAEDFNRLRQAQRGDFVVTSRDQSDRWWTVAYTLDDGPNEFHLYDRTTGELTKLFDDRPALHDHRLARTEPYSFMSRDGLTIHGYATFPEGQERAGLPAVIVVHGGPWGRDMWGYQPEVQWLANRGYLVMQVNFRGSTGYGKAFVNAGDREWGGRMHDDVVDAARFAVEQGWADAARVAIYGGSYGGYAALCGAAFTPDEFCCAVDICGPSNLKTLVESAPPYWVGGVAVQFRKRAGDPGTEPDFVWSRSPLSRADDIRIPLLIGQGANDPRVKQAESEQIVAALRERGIPHSYVLFDDEGHGFAKPANRLRFYAEAETFLAEHLGGRAEA